VGLLQFHRETAEPPRRRNGRHGRLRYSGAILGWARRKIVGRRDAMVMADIMGPAADRDRSAI